MIECAISTILAAATLLAGLRVIRGPSLADRVVALELIGVAATGFTIWAGVRFGQLVFLDIAIALALVSFVSSVAFAGYLERRAATELWR